MNQTKKREYLIDVLLKEQPQYRNLSIPSDATAQKKLLRSLMNVRMPQGISEEFLQIQDAYLKEAIREKGITEVSDLLHTEEGICLWRGDITTLRCDAIVNAANSGMTGCYQPCHHCIDNCIHTYAGIQLRLFCAKIMEKQGFAEPTGQAKITPAFNLPCKYVLHTVGPVVEGNIQEVQERQLASCYEACLELADKNGVNSLAFCCISTGVFGFPRKRAAEIAVNTVRKYRKETHSGIEVIFNVFREEDYKIYRGLLG